MKAKRFIALILLLALTVSFVPTDDPALRHHPLDHFFLHPHPGRKTLLPEGTGRSPGGRVQLIWKM